MKFICPHCNAVHVIDFPTSKCLRCGKKLQTKNGK